MRELKVEISYNKHVPQVKIGKYRVELIQHYSRWVFKVGKDFYFKIDKVKEKYDENTYPDHTLIELDRWKEFKDKDVGIFLCPPILNGVDERGCTWVLQPTCKKLAKGRRKVEDADAIAYAAKKIGVIDIAHYDYELRETFCQWGYYQGRPCIFDYGL